MTRTQIALSVPKELKDDFYKIAKALGTNPSNLLSMFMAHVVHTKEVQFRTSDVHIEHETFSPKELTDLIKSGKKSHAAISALIG